MLQPILKKANIINSYIYFKIFIIISLQQPTATNLPVAHNLLLLLIFSASSYEACLLAKNNCEKNESFETKTIFKKIEKDRKERSTHNCLRDYYFCNLLLYINT